MNGYIALYNGERIELYADSAYSAQQKALGAFRNMHPRSRPRPGQVRVYLAKKDGEEVVHVASE